MSNTATHKAEAVLLSLPKAFLAGALAVLVFQLGLAAMLTLAGLAPFPIYPMTPVPPFGVPQSLNWAFWGGLWGLVLFFVLRGRDGVGYWLTAILFGAIVVSAVLFFVVLPLKGQPVAFGYDMKLWSLVGSLHAAFGLGFAVFMRLLAGKF